MLIQTAVTIIFFLNAVLKFKCFWTHMYKFGTFPMHVEVVVLKRIIQLEFFQYLYLSLNPIFFFQTSKYVMSSLREHKHFPFGITHKTFARMYYKIYEVS